MLASSIKPKIRAKSLKIAGKVFFEIQRKQMLLEKINNANFGGKQTNWLTPQ
jgi:hypothetical protein